MSTSPDRLELPESLRRQLREFRGSLRRVKLLEGSGMGLWVTILSYLGLFVSDRFVDTPVWGRSLALAGMVAGLGIILAYGLRWVIGCSSPKQLARVIGRTYRSLGDQIQGVIELIEQPEDRTRSRALCLAAIDQVSQQTGQKDLRRAIPRPRHHFWWKMTAGALAAAGGLATWSIEASTQTLWRYLQPTASIARYTFTQFEPLVPKQVVPEGEPFPITLSLKPTTVWQPARASARWDKDPPLFVDRQGEKQGRYIFEFPGRVDRGNVLISVGDAYQRVNIFPAHRPEVSLIKATAILPKYLERIQAIERDGRGGSFAIVRGSQLSFAVETTRALRRGWLNDVEVAVQGPMLHVQGQDVSEKRTFAFRWEDEWGLTGARPFVLEVDGVEDAPPTVTCLEWPKQRVMIDSETLTLAIRAEDDFGVRTVGVEWQGIDKSPGVTPAVGEVTLGAGGSEAVRLELAGTFCPKQLEIAPQMVRVRLFAQDFLPGRPRAYSAPFTIAVLSPEQHAQWVTEQLSQWHRASLEVRDRERVLLQTNEQLRQLSDDELAQEQTRRRIEQQASAERDNGRRLKGLTGTGEKLLREAMKNPEIGVGHIESWARMLRTLQDIADRRMPSVADLLKQASQSALENEASSAPSVGQSQAPTPSGEGKDSSGKTSANPSVVDSEPATTPPSEKGEEASKPGQPKKGSAPAPLRLPVTTVAGSGGAGNPPPKRSSGGQKMEEAVAAHRELLAEFEKIADELNRVLANLEGSTLVKRLKAAARKQYEIAGKVGEQTAPASASTSKTPPPTLEQIATEEKEATKNVSYIMDDLEAYLARRPFQRFKSVLDEMKKEDLVGSLDRLADDIPKEKGMSAAQGEYWSDTLDRWADNLVDPACNGQCQGQGSKKSLPPSLVLEAMRILEGEMTLREETRVAEQQKPLAPKDHPGKAKKLEETQRGLEKRVMDLGEKIRELPDGEAEFSKELQILQIADLAMLDAAGGLEGLDTGKRTIGAETEAIEALLRSKKINPKGGGGGGGSTPGQGGNGDTDDPAIALLGMGTNEQEVREARPVTQATGETGSKLPEEFRAGLDEYFRRLEEAGEKK